MRSAKELGKELGKDLARSAAETSALRAGGKAVGHKSRDSFAETMAEGLVLAGAWFTVRMICQVSIKAIKTYRETKVEVKKENPEAKEAPSCGGVSAGNEENGIPWGHVTKGDPDWVEDFRRSASSSSRDNVRLLKELHGLGEKIDNLSLDALYAKLQGAMKSLLEYQQHPDFRDASATLQQARRDAKTVYHNEESLEMSLSALRLMVVTTYLHGPKHSSGQESSINEREIDKNQCEFYVFTALKQEPLKSLCRKFLASRDGEDDQSRERMEREATLAFDIILEVMSSVYLLEPFRPSKGHFPDNAPDIVLLALSTYCKRDLGSSLIYTGLAEALDKWESAPERQEKWALHCLYMDTSGPGWACNKGWDNLFEEADLSNLYGVSTEKGRVTKISLGANNLEGRIPAQLGNFGHLQELSLHGNTLYGRVPAKLWDLPHLRVVALHGNRVEGTPPATFKSAGGSTQAPARRPDGISGTVKSCSPDRMEVYKGDWFTCSWKIINTGDTAFSKATTLVRVEEKGKPSVFEGAKKVMINPLEPGDEQTVSVMQQAPNNEKWAIKDVWKLSGEGLDFRGEDEAQAQTPIIKVVARPAGGGVRNVGDARFPTIADTVFVAANRHHRGSTHNFPPRAGR